MSDYYKYKPNDCDDGLPLFDSTVKNAARGAKDGTPDADLKAADASKADKLLAYLQEHRVATTAELVHVAGHRFSTSVLVLRQRGWHITVERVDGANLYTLGKLEELVPVTDEVKEAYYATPHWIAKRNERMAYDGWRCIQCQCETHLECHHWEYNLFDESMEELSTLCEDCHTYVSELTRKVVCWPKSVPQSIYDRIMGGDDDGEGR